ncbi:MAG: hypothetical protein AAFQ83_08750 [Bacteroidota bacterium]
MTHQQSMPCPVCKNPILFDTYMLLQGIQFTCTKCNTSIGLAAESRGIVSNTMEKLEEVRKEVLKGKKKN